ncbi:MAG: alpha/beta hydrolase [Dehalococcoidia bacterium]|jgi:pimeloyl-ACP methyl ester carboxylesterase|nr:alpha/beta hydrolase [Dehalococcoidia bacterium]
MPFISSHGVSIHYELEGDSSSPPLLLHHGWTSDIESWRDFGYVAAFQDRFRLILIDARAHGLSDAPEDANAYASELFVADVAAVLDAVNPGPVIFWGYSMGAAIGFQLAIHSPDRMSRFVAGGMHPYGNSPTGEPRPTNATAELRERGMAGFVEARELDLGGRLVPKLRTRLLAASANGLANAGEAWAGWKGVGERVGDIAIPTLLYAGTGDSGFHEGASRAADEMPDARFVSIPGISHDAGFASSRTVLAAIGDFLA